MNNISMHEGEKLSVHEGERMTPDRKESDTGIEIITDGRNGIQLTTL